MKRATVARKAAVESGARTYLTGLPCKRGHVADRLTSNGTCIQCLPAVRAAWKAGNPAVVAANARYYSENTEAVSALNKAWRQSNPARMKQLRAAHYQQNKASYTAASRARKSHIARATPPWADMKAITKVYAEAMRLTKETGTAYEVDHTIPLRGMGVCGLHVHWNLKPMPAALNRAKGNHSCGAEHDRDVNAAKNIARRGLASLAVGAHHGE